jgi:hypothetical protein
LSGNFPATGERDLTRIVTAIRDLFMGRSNAMGEFTLTANAATTTVAATNCGEQSVISLTPRTANAAAALATTYITAANTTPGQFIVNHANNAQVDKVFAYSISG